MRLHGRAIPVALVFALLCVGGAAVLLASGCDDAISQGEPKAYPIASATHTPLPTPSAVAPLATPTAVTPTATRIARPSPTVTATAEAWTLYLPAISEDVPPTPSPSATPEPTSTPVPSPTPTPTIPWPEALAEPGLSKLGLHVQWNNSPEILEFVRRMKPAVIKGMDDLGFVAEVKEASPQTIVVARLTHLQPTDGDPEAMARAFVASNLETYLRHPAVDYWEGYNEPDVHGRLDWYARFEAERVRAMAEHGLRAAIGSFSTGVPEYDEFAAFLPAVRAARQHGGVLSLHEYDAPTFDRSIGAGLPGHPNHADRGALALRYRWWYEDILKPSGLVIPLIVTEAGVDGLVTNRPGPSNAGGWMDFVPYWREQYPSQDPLSLYLSQLEWYDRQVQQDDYVIGWALFTAGAMGPQWASYDITPYLRQVATEILAPQAR